jgi:hypothetical protein
MHSYLNKTFRHEYKKTRGYVEKIGLCAFETIITIWGWASTLDAASSVDSLSMWFETSNSMARLVRLVTHTLGHTASNTTFLSYTLDVKSPKSKTIITTCWSTVCVCSPVHFFCSLFLIDHICIFEIVLHQHIYDETSTTNTKLEMLPSLV